MNLPDKLGEALQRQALAWLRAGLALYAQMAQRDDPAWKQSVRQHLEHSRQSPDPASLPDTDALAMLPPDEQQAWRKFRDDLDALRKKVQRETGAPQFRATV
jgi:hypothetical protein